MVYRKKVIGKVMNYGSAALGMLSAFGLGHAVRSINSTQLCTTLASISPGYMSSLCADGTVANIFTTAATNTTVAAMECVPYLNLDTQLVAACFTPLSALAALSITGLGLAAYLKRKASHLPASAV